MNSSSINSSFGATFEGTTSFKKKHPQIHPDKWRRFQNLTVSSIALGSYLGSFSNYDDELLENAVNLCLNEGLNFIDTAINYRCQRSERSIGRALNSLMAQNKIHRSEFVISTKGGFLPFDNEPASDMQKYVHQQWIEKGIITSQDIVANCHCMHPDFIKLMIDQSLKNLNLETIDLYYLHNPETQLPYLGHTVFYEKLKKVFEVFEEAVSKGKIQYYGLATWTAFREIEGALELLSLEKIIQVAENVCGNKHHFKAIQLPYNLAMLEAIEVANQNHNNEKLPIIAAASYKEIDVMISVPLLQGQILNLPDSVMNLMPTNATHAQKALQFVTSTPAVTSAMVGMKQTNHIDENKKILTMPDWPLEKLQKIGDQLVGS